MAEFEDVVSKLSNAKKSGNGYTARCPCHKDKQNSLKVDRGRDRPVVVHCHAGCDPKQILAALGVKPKGNGKAKPIEKTFDYLDAQGNFVYQTVRVEYGPKDKRIWQRRKSAGETIEKKGEKIFVPAGGWIDSLKSISPLPYRLPELVKADPDEPVFIVEGEPKVELLRSWHLVATCNSGGAGKWQESFAGYFKGREVVLLPDNDETGEKHALKVTSMLSSAVKSIRVLRLPGLPEKGDIIDWHRAGHTQSEFLELYQADSEKADKDTSPVDQLTHQVSPVSELLSTLNVPWLIKYHIARNALTLAVGPAGSLKTFHALAMMLDLVAAGYKVVFFPLEGRSGLGARIGAHYFGDRERIRKLADSDRFYWWKYGLNVLDEDSKLRALAAMSEKKPDVICIDTLAQTIPGEDENNSRPFSAAMTFCQNAMIQNDCGVLLLHHPRKDSDKYRGHSNLHGGIDIGLSYSLQGYRLTISNWKQKDAEPFDPYELTSITVPTGQLDQDGKPIHSLRLLPPRMVKEDESVLRIDGDERKIIEELCLAVNAGGMSPKDIKESTGITTNLNRILNRLMVDHCLIRKIGAGKAVLYTLNGSAEEVLTQVRVSRTRIVETKGTYKLDPVSGLPVIANGILLSSVDSQICVANKGLKPDENQSEKFDSHVDSNNCTKIVQLNSGSDSYKGDFDSNRPADYKGLKPDENQISLFDSHLILKNDSLENSDENQHRPPLYGGPDSHDSDSDFDPDENYAWEGAAPSDEFLIRNFGWPVELVRDMSDDDRRRVVTGGLIYQKGH